MRYVTQHVSLPGPWDKKFFAKPTGLQKLVGKQAGEQVRGPTQSFPPAL
jgi:hypothetical protein